MDRAHTLPSTQHEGDAGEGDIPSQYKHYCVVLLFIMLLCSGQGSLLCSLWCNSRLAIHLVYRAPAQHGRLLYRVFRLYINYVVLQAGEGKKGTDKAVFVEIFTTRNYPQLKATFDAYKNVSI